MTPITEQLADVLRVIAERPDDMCMWPDRAFKDREIARNMLALYDAQVERDRAQSLPEFVAELKEPK